MLSSNILVSSGIELSWRMESIMFPESNKVMIPELTTCLKDWFNILLDGINMIQMCFTKQKL